MSAQDWSIIGLLVFTLIIVGFDCARQEIIAEWRRSHYAEASRELLKIIDLFGSRNLSPDEMARLFELGRRLSELGLQAVRDAKWIDGGIPRDTGAEGALTKAFYLFRDGQYMANALRWGR